MTRWMRSMGRMAGSARSEMRLFSSSTVSCGCTTRQVLPPRLYSRSRSGSPNKRQKTVEEHWRKRLDSPKHTALLVTQIHHLVDDRVVCGARPGTGGRGEFWATDQVGDRSLVAHIPSKHTELKLGAVAVAALAHGPPVVLVDEPVVWDLVLYGAEEVAGEADRDRFRRRGFFLLAVLCCTLRRGAPGKPCRCRRHSRCGRRRCRARA